MSAGARKPLGRAERRRFGRVHEDMRYDLEVDTLTLPPLECAAAIKERLGL